MTTQRSIGEERNEAADAETRWQAVQERDRSLDGTFVFAVSSTGIYCMPSCPSRRPRRERVAFFETPAEAEQAGYRACLRCHPAGGGPAPAANELARAARDYIGRNLEGDLSLETLGKALGVSPYHLQRSFKEAVGVSPRQYATGLRLERVKASLREGDSVAGAIYDAGFSSSSRVYEQAPARLGMTPLAYSRGGSGMEIGYTIVDSAAGRMLVAGTERGLSALSFGDDDRTLEDALRKEYPAARIERDGQRLGEWVSAILESMDEGRPYPDLPLDVQATAFQWRVWEALKRIPYGQTRSYSAVAESLGNPSAARAVAHACATNRVALLVPCHRVVRSDGSMGGYRWGIERKKRILRRESASQAAG